MFRRLLACAVVLVSLSACSETAAPPAAVDSPAAAPAPSQAAPASPAAATPDAAQAASTPAPAPAGPSLPARPGIDYEQLPVPQPTFGQGKIEVAEVFGYSCIHCAQFQPVVNAWKPTLPADVRWEYVPAVFGGVWDEFARAYFAAQALGVAEQTHDAIYKGVFEDQAIKSGTADEVADLYAKLGVDRARFVSTAKSFGVTAKVNRAKQFAMRTGVTGTPTIIVNGKYRVSASDRGFEGMLATVDQLVAMERAALAAAAAPAEPAAASQ